MEVKEHIVQQSLSLFLKKGVKQVNMDEVASNLGISILPQSATANNYSNDLINILPFESPIPFRRVAMAFRRGSSKQTSLVKIIKSITIVKEKIIAS